MMNRVNLILSICTFFVLTTSCSKEDGPIPSNINADININNPIPVAEGDAEDQSIIFLITIAEADPNNSISVEYAISGGNQNGTGGTLTFPANTNTLTQTVTVTKTGNNIVEEDVPVTVLLFNPSSNANLKNNNIGTSSFVDDDEAGYTVTPQSLTTIEGGSAKTFTVVLDKAPTSDVVFDIASTDTSEGTVSPDNITFNTGNFDTPITVTITPVNDAINDGDISYPVTVGVNTSLSNALFIGLSSTNVSVTNQNN